MADVIRLIPNLESLFLGVNFLRDDGAASVLSALIGHSTLQRLEIGANGLTDASLPKLLELVRTTQLHSLILGSYKSTRYFDGARNAFSDVSSLVELAKHVKYLDLDGAVEAVDFDAFTAALQRETPTTLVFAVQGHSGAKRVLSADIARDPRLVAIKRLAHPQPFVDNIQSIYRNAM